MNNLISIHTGISRYPDVRINSVSQVFTLKHTSYDKESLDLKGTTLDDSFRYIPEKEIFVNQSFRSYQNYQLTIF